MKETKSPTADLSSDSNTVIFAIDIEARGQGPWRHGIISIGVCVGTSGSTDKVMTKKRFDMLPLKHQAMSKKCKEEFWDKHPNHLDALTRDAQPPDEAIRAFRTLLDVYDSQRSVYIVSDNPGFDFGMINFYLDYFNLPTLNQRRTADGKLEYRNTHDCDSYGRALLKQGFDSPWLSNKDLIIVYGATYLKAESADHMPENDAELIYKLHRHVVWKHAYAPQTISVMASRYIDDWLNK